MPCKKFKLLGLLLVLALGLVAAGCRDLSYAAGDPKKMHVGIVFDSGGKDDRSFNAAAYRGVTRAAKDFPIVLRDAEPGDPASLEPAMRAFAEVGYDLVIGIGFAQTPIVESVAKDYPKVNFAIVDGVSSLPNVASLIFKEHEGSYLVGMIAARATKTGTIGFVGGMDVPLIHKFEVGYEEGARAVNPKIRVIQNYVGVTEAAWNNPGKGKELAVAQIGKGADVVFAAAGNSGLGVFDAAEQYDKLVIGVDSNQNWVKPGHVLTSMVKRVDNAVYRIIEDLVNHRFKGGIHVYGLPDGGIGYAMDQYNAKLIPPEVIREVEAAKARIIRGEIKVTDAMAK
ncbi:MAG TPA: BMP family ABC transporter substrate-binding protein [Thermoanaerobaculia bacterium]|jgi:basic membrane protein A|nr:BMP family ABC transporter substrate-binding protein [Thermoanaerobaculia bacterium]